LALEKQQKKNNLTLIPAMAIKILCAMPGFTGLQEFGLFCLDFLYAKMPIPASL
jgi:hypothetical protein